MRVAPFIVLLALLAPSFGPPVRGADYRYSVQLGDPTTVIRTDRDTGATLVCRNTGHGIWCPPAAGECRPLLDRVRAWQAEHELPSQQQVIDCLQHDRCDTPPPPVPPAGAIPGADPQTLTYCLEHQGDDRPRVEGSGVKRPD